MLLTQEQIKHIANLSRLSLSDDELQKYEKDLNSILDYIDKLSQIDNKVLEGIPFDTTNILPLRSDDLGEKNVSREELLVCSPKKIINHQIAIGNIMN